MFFSSAVSFWDCANVFEIEHIDTAGLSENDKDEILEEILSKSEKSFGHSRQVQEHSKFKQLHKYLFVYTKGKKNTEGTRTSSSMSSAAAGMKGKASQKMALDLLGRPELDGFRADMIDIFLNNDLSGQRSARVLGNASLAGTQHIQDLQVAPGKNAFREPAPYELQVTAFNEATDAEEKSKLHADAA